MKNNELIFYLRIAIAVFSAITIPAIITEEPNLDPPNRQRTATSDEPITTSKTTSFSPTNGGPTTGTGSNANLFRNIMFVLLVVAIGGILFYLIRSLYVMSSSRIQSSEEMEKLEEKKVKKLIDARTQAYQILRDGIVNKTYTESYIKAYHALDKDLDYFREIARPKYWTPKEYAFSVRDPLFRPSIYSFVKLFYNLRYGMQNAFQSDLEIFIQALDRLFTEDIDLTLRTRLLADYKSELEGQSVYAFPSTRDPTKPGR
jgi:hypothetical protein